MRCESWPALSEKEIQARVEDALANNECYRRDTIFGLPGSHLDSLVFPPSSFLAGKPFLGTLVQNPNHIGCHSLGPGEPMARGTVALELDALRICAEEILGAEAMSWDGYISSGGTESNIQAIWTYRNELQSAGIAASAITVLFSEDAHYSFYKACDLTGLDHRRLPVWGRDRQIDPTALTQHLSDLVSQGQRAVIVILTMGTTMFGSVDDPAPVLDKVTASGLTFRCHVDAAFGGFLLPFTDPCCPLNFTDPRLHSFTLDAHKALQAPYGTGVFLIRKGLLDHTRCAQASYVPGGDVTLCGSRSGANAVAVWMILNRRGREGLEGAARELAERSRILCEGLKRLGIESFRAPGMNLVAIPASAIPKALAQAFRLVADRQDSPAWLKVVVMDHVRRDRIQNFLDQVARHSVCEELKQPENGMEQDMNATITETSLLSDLATRHAGASRVFHRYGLDFCCRGRTPLATACAEKSIDVNSVIKELEAETAADDFTSWSDKPAASLVDHIVTRFHEHHRSELPRLLEMARKVERVHGAKLSCPHGLADHLALIQREMFDHMTKEEQVLFPMLLRGQGTMAQGPINCMEHEHVGHGENLALMRKLASDYQPPAEACGTWRALFLGLNQLEEDLMEHIHLENNILFPRSLGKFESA